MMLCNNHFTIFVFLKSYVDAFCLFSLQNGLNALHLAAKEGHKDLVEELLERGAPVDSSTKVRACVSVFITLYQPCRYEHSAVLSLAPLGERFVGGKKTGGRERVIAGEQR